MLEQREFRRQAEVFRAIAETAEDSIFCKDVERRYSFVNPAMGRLFQCRPEHLLGKRSEDLFDTANAAVIAEVDRQAFGGEVANAVRTLELNGEEKVFHTVQVPLRDDDGAITGICGIVRDVTDFRRAEEAEKRTRAQFRTAIESLPFDFFAIGHDGRYIIQNEVCRRHWGDVLGKRPEDVAPDPDTLTLWTSNNARAMAGETVRAEVKLARPEGERWFFNIIAPIFEDDRIEGILGLNVDIHERKLAEGRLAQQRDSLDGQVRARTRELQALNARLQQQLDETRRVEHEILTISSRERRQIGQDVHDTLGQELAGISFLSSALARRLRTDGRPEADDAERLTTAAREAIEHAKAIARGLSPIQDVTEEGFRMALDRIAEDSSRLFGVECTVHEAMDLPICDDTIAAQVCYIITECVANAARHGEAGHIDLYVRTSRDHGEVVVEDDGRGFPDDPSAQGGMGLRIMRNRAHTIGGELSHGRTEQGRTFVLCSFRNRRTQESEEADSWKERGAAEHEEQQP